MINAICLRITDWLVPGFEVGSAFIGALLISLTSMVINRLVLNDGR